MVSAETRVALETSLTLERVARCAVVALVSLAPRQAIVAGRPFISFWSLSAGLTWQTGCTFFSDQVLQVVRNVLRKSGVTPVAGWSGCTRFPGLAFLSIVALLADGVVSGFSLSASQARKAFRAISARVTWFSVVTMVSLEAHFAG